MRSNAGEKHWKWKGNDVGYYALHVWITKRFPKPDLCQICKLNPPLDLANKSREYRRALDDWMWVCRSCHMLYDDHHKDMSDRVCNRCESLETATVKNGWRQWKRSNGGWICKKCINREYYITHRAGKINI